MRDLIWLLSRSSRDNEDPKHNNAGDDQHPVMDIETEYRRCLRQKAQRFIHEQFVADALFMVM